MNNLKNVSVDLPRNRLVVVTGVSGSGKTTFVFDTLYAEGHRRYVESLSSYARQFLSRMAKPPVDVIEGLSPAIAVRQKAAGSGGRSSVGSITELYDYLRLLFAKVGRVISPVTGREVKPVTVEDVVDFIAGHPSGTRIYVLTPFKVRKGRTVVQELEIALGKGFSRVWANGKPVEIETMLGAPPDRLDNVYLNVDRFKFEVDDEDFRFRAADSVQSAFAEGEGACAVWAEGGKIELFSDKFEEDGVKFERPTEALFNYNSPVGACPVCQASGKVVALSERFVVPNPQLSINEGAVTVWNVQGMKSHGNTFMRWAVKNLFPIHKPYRDLSEQEKNVIWKGTDRIVGLEGVFKQLRETGNTSTLNRLSNFCEIRVCTECGGAKIRKEALYVQISGYHIGQLLAGTLAELKERVDTLVLTDYQAKIGARLLTEIKTRLKYLNDVGLGYLSLNREAHTLSGGEMQRLNLANRLGNNLTGAMYILDEPSVGLHPRDSERLAAVLQSLRDMGNTVIVVEHDETLIRAADYVVDFGPKGGEFGGQVVFAGVPSKLSSADTLTAKYLTGRQSVPVPAQRKRSDNFIVLFGARTHNLKNLTVRFPVAAMTVVTGVSGSGKTTLCKRVLYPAVCQKIGQYGAGFVELDGVSLENNAVRYVELVDQEAVGRHQRSNPATYVGAFDFIREWMAQAPEARQAGLHAGHFSFNSFGGRCEHCEGEGYVTIEMQFLADVELVCEHCGGKRYKPEILEIYRKGLNIHDVLNLSVEEACAFFADEKKIRSRLDLLRRVGLGYLRLGQSVSTLSGGEAQRLKLASFLERRPEQTTLYIFDEPSTGLHFEDVRLLVKVMRELTEAGHTVVIIEHNPEIVKTADWVIDLGPEGGDGGGNLLYQGPPEGLLQVPQSHTGRFLVGKISPNSHA
jgi:excinuclease ABC subunit A